MKLRFPKLAAAMAEYDRTAPARRGLWDTAVTDADVSRAAGAESDACLKVREAFAADDANPNSRENAMLLDMATARQWAKFTLR